MSTGNNICFNTLVEEDVLVHKGKKRGCAAMHISTQCHKHTVITMEASPRACVLTTHTRHRHRCHKPQTYLQRQENTIIRNLYNTKN